MTSPEKQTSIRLQSVLKQFTDILIDCPADASIFALVSGAAKSVRDTIDRLDQMHVARSVLSDELQTAAPPQPAESWEATFSATADDTPVAPNSRSIADMMRIADERANSNGLKRKVLFAAEEKGDANGSESDDVCTRPRKKLVRRQKSRNKDQINELFEKAETESSDGFCVIDGCRARVQTRGLCSKDYKALLRASEREEQKQ